MDWTKVKFEDPIIVKLFDDYVLRYFVCRNDYGGVYVFSSGCKGHNCCGFTHYHEDECLPATEENLKKYGLTVD